MEKADKFGDLVFRDLIWRKEILYKYFSDVVELLYRKDNGDKQQHKYSRKVTDIFNNIKYLGGRFTLKSLRGPMNINQGKKRSE